MADLPGVAYIFSPNVAQTEEKPDIVLWNDETVHLVELTVPFETGIVETADRKQKKYSPLVACCRENSFRTNLVTVEVGSRGFLHRHSLHGLYNLVKAPHKDKLALEEEMIRRAISGSFRIWCLRNWQHPD